MVEERGRVVAIEQGAIWVETIQRSGCHGCSAKSGCGTGLLGDYLSGATRIRVALNSWDPDNISLNDTAVIGIAENALASSALLVYLLPLVSLVLAALAGDRLAGETGAIVGALAGLIAGALFVRWFSRRHVANPSYTPLLLRIEPSIPR
ncbi:positive regulator of sigma(E), RseC/MucC [Microbulbifer donghaiensis]|uniref:Positive regulator of sigma(E), RseC/MucC n=1 Tax=Microbulbifer donghaiensis TaxID=494016 RepID=A0A1M4WNU1_9GAMM|nr:SoxR reducing system RseC family protein [Microbulbifer donghaiensis]SHE82713.1 positive regulator of sigma(E), RseC/MucC [Microbulbifer donghaiensis]